MCSLGKRAKPQRDLQLTAPEVLQIMSPAQPGRTQLVSAIPSDSLLAIGAHWRLEKENSVRDKFRG